MDLITELATIINSSNEVARDIEKIEVNESTKTRAPIAPVTSKLIDQDSLLFTENQYVAPRTIFDSFRNFKDESNKIIGNVKEKKHLKLLSELYRPPLELFFKGTFEQAKATAFSEKKWLFVHIHQTDVFQSQVVVRDLFRMDSIKTIIKNHFVLWWVDVRSNTYDYFKAFYGDFPAPHSALIDPETGELLLNITYPLSKNELSEKLNNFLETHSFTGKPCLVRQRIIACEDDSSSESDESNSDVEVLAVKRKNDNVEDVASKRIANEDTKNVGNDIDERAQQKDYSPVRLHETNTSFSHSTDDKISTSSNTDTKLHSSPNEHVSNLNDEGKVSPDKCSTNFTESNEKEQHQIHSVACLKPLLLRIRSNVLPAFTFTTQGNKTVRDFRADIFAEMIRKNSSLAKAKSVENIKLVVPIGGQKQLDDLNKTIEEEGIVDRTVVVVDFCS